ncbi:hypothetical protein [Ralstonia pseudosolanacearum]|uniref:hypothetical protein n=1 Tax=Ralstonia pseudosolanacearum TaxID=1310165 RepID=UPI003CF8CEF8
MNITSTLKDQSQFPETFVVLDTITPFGSLSVSMGVGALEGRNLHLTEVGEAAFNRMNELGKAKEGQLHVVEVISRLKAKKAVPETFMKAKSGDTVFFVCKDSGVYDTVFKQLSVSDALAAQASQGAPAV